MTTLSDFDIYALFTAYLFILILYNLKPYVNDNMKALINEVLIFIIIFTLTSITLVQKRYFFNDNIKNGYLFSGFTVEPMALGCNLLIAIACFYILWRLYKVIIKNE